jgi:hypothetical protein
MLWLIGSGAVAFVGYVAVLCDTTTLRAVVLQAPGGPEQLVCAQVPTPAPGRGEALVRVHAAALTHDELGPRSHRRGEVSSLYFVVEPSGRQLAPIARLFDEGWLPSAIDSAFPLARGARQDRRPGSGDARQLGDALPGYARTRHDRSAQVKASHVPMISQPGATTKIILTAGQAAG